MFRGWAFEPDIVIGTLLACLIYAAGIKRGRDGSGRRTLRHLSHFAGVASIFLALESPIDALADHLFWMHQIQHLLLRMIGPMLIALSAPQAVLVRGLPRPIREAVLAPLMGQPVLRSGFGLLTAAPVVTVLFIAALFVWQYPPIHNAAILNDGIHYTMHVTMLLAGLLFFWRVFDMRPAATELAYGKRLMMLLVAMLAQIGLGAFLTLKGGVLYPAYDVAGRYLSMKPLADEMVGGFIVWVPSSMMCLIAVIVVIHAWGTAETRCEERRLMEPASQASWRPATGADLVARARPNNRIVALAATGFVIFMFAVAIFVGVLDRLNARTPGGLFARATAVGEIAR